MRAVVIHRYGGADLVRLEERDRPVPGDEPLTDALCRLYSHVYGVAEDEVRGAASERALAMRLSDAWVAQGCSLDSPLLPRERAALVRSYAALLAAVHRPPGDSLIECEL